jgi:hypothetical protein
VNPLDLFEVTADSLNLVWTKLSTLNQDPLLGFPGGKRIVTLDLIQGFGCPAQDRSFVDTLDKAQPATTNAARALKQVQGDGQRNLLEHRRCLNRMKTASSI